MAKGVRWGEGKHRNENYRLSERVPLPDPSEGDTAAVLAAFDVARANNEKSVDCYKSAKRVWMQRHPEQTEKFSAMQAIAVVFNHRSPLYWELNERETEYKDPHDIARKG